MGRQGLGGAGAAGRSMQRSQSRSSLSASFEALAGYFPCMNSLEEEEEGEAVCGWPFCLQFASRRVSGWRVGRGRALRVAVVCPLPSRGLCRGRETPRARRLSLGEVLGDLESSAGADWGSDFPSEVELSSMWKLEEDVDCWEAGTPVECTALFFCLPQTRY